MPSFMSLALWVGTDFGCPGTALTRNLTLSRKTPIKARGCYEVLRLPRSLSRQGFLPQNVTFGIVRNHEPGFGRANHTLVQCRGPAGPRSALFHRIEEFVVVLRGPQLVE